jgi:hypothetical protein
MAAKRGPVRSKSVQAQWRELNDAFTTINKYMRQLGDAYDAARHGERKDELICCTWGCGGKPFLSVDAALDQQSAAVQPARSRALGVKAKAARRKPAKRATIKRRSAR